MFMSLAELRAMARAKHAKKVCAWLEKNAVPYRLDLAGQPIVLIAHVEAAFEGKGAPSGRRPNFAALGGRNAPQTPEGSAPS